MLFLFKISRKPIYDLLIELSAAARLIPSNYALKLYNDVDDNKDHDLDKVIEYTPNQKIGQLSKYFYFIKFLILLHKLNDNVKHHL